MSHVELPAELFQQIEQSLPVGGSVEEFVREAVARKLHDEERRKEFHRLSGEIRDALRAKGLTEEEILADFEKQRPP